ncbi:MAG TPA: ABC transporter permease [Terriglobales bacterium]|nr:ABC transporter permease [Terriglobales bacterium]
MAFFHAILGEVRYALRLLVRNPGFTLVATLSLALGIGANSAIFSLADALLLRPLAIYHPSSVVAVSTDPATDSGAMGGVSYPDYRDFRDKAHSFDGLAAMELSRVSVVRSTNDSAHLRAALMVSGNFFQVLGVEPALGRGFLAEEDSVSGGNPVAVLAYDFWRTDFSSDPSILGRTMRINGIDFTIVGVAPKGFTGVDQYVRPHLYVPAAMTQRLSASTENQFEDRNSHDFDVKGRLKSGVTREQAQAELATIWKGLEPLHSVTDRQRMIRVRTELQARVVQDPPDAYLITLLMVLVGVVLIIACANVANLLLGRARGRSREIAIRLALGVTRGRLVRQLLTESVLLAMLGAIVGLGFAYGGIRFLQTIRIPTDLPIVISPQLDGRVLVFSLACAIASAIVFGLAPALQSSRVDLVPALKSAESGQPGQRRLTGRNVLVIAQVAMSMILLIATGMLMDGFRNALVLNPGFRIDHMLTMQFDTSLVRYTQAQSHDFYRDLVEKARALPAVRALTLASTVPLSPAQNGENVAPEGYQFPKGQFTVGVLSSVVDENYFEVMQTPVVRGRAFTATDKEGAPAVAIVNEQFAKTYWPGQDAIGKRLRIDSKKNEWLQVVGVAKTGKYTYTGEPPTTFLYLPFAQNPRKSMYLLTNSYGDSAALAAPLRELAHVLDPDQPVFNVRTMEDFYQIRAISVMRIIVEVVGTMGAVGLALALIGLYGLIAYSVARRTREIGVRMAIGARRSDVLNMVLQQGLKLSVAGILIGGAISVGVSRALTAGFVGLGHPNSATYVIVPLVLLLVTMASCYLPALRASRTDPMVALRYE